MPAKGMGNVTVTYNAVALTNYCNTAQMDAVIAAIDTTHFGSTAEETTPGSAKWKVDLGGNWDIALDNVAGPDSVSPPTTKRALVIVFGPVSNRATYTWASGSAYISNYVIKADPKGMITWTATLEISGAPTRS